MTSNFDFNNNPSIRFYLNENLDRGYDIALVFGKEEHLPDNLPSLEGFASLYHWFNVSRNSVLQNQGISRAMAATYLGQMITSEWGGEDAVQLGPKELFYSVVKINKTAFYRF